MGAEASRANVKTKAAHLSASRRRATWCRGAWKRRKRRLALAAFLKHGGASAHAPWVWCVDGARERWEPCRGLREAAQRGELAGCARRSRPKPER
eukprot:654708-Pyramimonas_sp.AAC.4